MDDVVSPLSHSQPSALPRRVYFTFQFFNLPFSRTPSMTLQSAYASYRGGAGTAGSSLMRMSTGGEVPAVFVFSLTTSGGRRDRESKDDDGEAGSNCCRTPGAVGVVDGNDG